MKTINYTFMALFAIIGIVATYGMCTGATHQVATLVMSVGIIMVLNSDNKPKNPNYGQKSN